MSKPKYQSRNRFPHPPFDQVHADAIEAVSADVLLQDPTISIADRREGRWWIKEFDAKYRAAALAPKSSPVSVTRDTTPIEPYQTRRSRHVSAWVAGVMFVACLVLLAIATVVSL